MNEKLFRGKTIKTNEWIYGSLVTNEEKGSCFIVEKCNWYRNVASGAFDASEMYVQEVEPESVGQFVGMYDKNNRKIFEGDKIVLYCVDPTGNGQDEIRHFEVAIETIRKDLHTSKKVSEDDPMYVKEFEIRGVVFIRNGDSCVSGIDKNGVADVSKSVVIGPDVIGPSEKFKQKNEENCNHCNRLCVNCKHYNEDLEYCRSVKCSESRIKKESCDKYRYEKRENYCKKCGKKLI